MHIFNSFSYIYFFAIQLSLPFFLLDFQNKCFSLRNHFLLFLWFKTPPKNSEQLHLLPPKNAYCKFQRGRGRWGGTCKAYFSTPPRGPLSWKINCNAAAKTRLRKHMRQTRTKKDPRSSAKSGAEGAWQWVRVCKSCLHVAFCAACIFIDMTLIWQCTEPRNPNVKWQLLRLRPPPSIVTPVLPPDPPIRRAPPSGA